MGSDRKSQKTNYKSSKTVQITRGMTKHPCIQTLAVPLIFFRCWNETVEINFEEKKKKAL